jgi:hypothetical protein
MREFSIHKVPGTEWDAQQVLGYSAIVTGIAALMIAVFLCHLYKKQF